MYACKELSTDLTQCLEWVEVNPLFLPDITKEQADSILVTVIGALISIYVCKLLLNLIKKG
jgi:hypothetical protein